MYCFVCYLNDTNHDVLSSFPKIFRRCRMISEYFRKFSKYCPKVVRTFLIISRPFQKIVKDFQRFPRKFRRCFDRRTTHLSNVINTFSLRSKDRTDIYSCMSRYDTRELKHQAFLTTRTAGRSRRTGSRPAFLARNRKVKQSVFL